MKNNEKNPYWNSRIQKLLNKLISEEWLAGQMYRFYIYAMAEDENYDYCKEKFLEISEDEIGDHLEALVEWAMEYGYSVPCKEEEYEKYADESSVRLFKNFQKNKNAEYYIQNAIKSEQESMKSYEDALGTEELQEFGDLAAIFQKNYWEENEHIENLNVLLYTFSISVEVK